MGRVKHVFAWIGIALLAIAVSGAIFQRAATAAAFRHYKPAGRMIDIGGRKLHIDCTGDGPSVVLEAGFGGWSIDWSTVQPEIAKFARVCSYDRAGMGYSDRGLASATSRTGIAKDLHTLLRKAGVPGPYVLVGHSLGGIFVRQFARMYPRDTAGLVFVDSTHEEIAKSVSKKEYDKAMSQLTQLRYGRWLMPLGVQRLMNLSISNAPNLPKPEKARAKGIGYRSSSYFALYDEMRSFVAENNSGKLKLEPIPHVPLVVIATTQNLNDPEHGAVWNKLQHELLALSPGAKYVVANSGHFVQVDEPHIVIDAVREVVEAAHASRRS